VNRGAARRNRYQACAGMAVRTNRVSRARDPLNAMLRLYILSPCVFGREEGWCIVPAVIFVAELHASGRRLRLRAETDTNEAEIIRMRSRARCKVRISNDRHTMALRKY